MNSQQGRSLVEFRQTLDVMEPQFQKVLPSHLPVAKFRRVIETALQMNPKLLLCDRRSLSQACMLAAQDGLLPDGRDGVITMFKSREGGFTAQWMPMISGIRKKVHNSGELLDWNVQVVQEGDEFEFELGDNPFIRHRPSLTGGRSRPVIAAYSIATYKNGFKSREFMNIDQIEEVRRATSRGEKGPWSNKVFYPEMCRKTVARLHAKQLPMSTDIDETLHRDDALFEIDRNDPPDPPDLPPSGRRTAADVLEAFANGDEASAVDDVAETEIRTVDPSTPGTATGSETQTVAATYDLSVSPKTREEYEDYVIDTLNSFIDEAMLRSWWLSDMEKQLRAACGVDNATMARLKQHVLDRVSVIKTLADDDYEGDEYAEAGSKGKW